MFYLLFSFVLTGFGPSIVLAPKPAANISSAPQRLVSYFEHLSVLGFHKWFEFQLRTLPRVWTCSTWPGKVGHPPMIECCTYPRIIKEQFRQEVGREFIKLFHDRVALLRAFNFGQAEDWETQTLIVRVHTLSPCSEVFLQSAALLWTETQVTFSQARVGSNYTWKPLMKCLSLLLSQTNSAKNGMLLMEHHVAVNVVETRWKQTVFRSLDSQCSFQSMLFRKDKKGRDGVWNVYFPEFISKGKGKGLQAL